MMAGEVVLFWSGKLGVFLIPSQTLPIIFFLVCFFGQLIGACAGVYGLDWVFEAF